MSKRTRHGTPWKKQPKIRRNDNQKQKTQEKNHIPKNVVKTSDETSEDGSDWEEIMENFTDLGEDEDFENLTRTITASDEEEFSSPETMRREGADCEIFQIAEILQRHEPVKCDDCGQDLVVSDDAADKNENQELEKEKSWSLIGNTSDGEENELDVSFGDGIMQSTERESRTDYNFTCFQDPTNLKCSKDDTHISETLVKSSTVIKQPEKSKEQFDVILGDTCIRSTDRKSRMIPNFEYSVEPTNSKCGKDFTHIIKTQSTSSTAIKQSEKSRDHLGVSDGNHVLHPTERESRNKSKDVNFTSSVGSTTLKIDEKCTHNSATQIPSAPTMKLPEKSQKQVKKDSTHKSLQSSGKGSKKKNYSISFNAPVHISLQNCKDDCNCVSKSLNNRGSKISKDLSQHILEFFDKKKNNSARESCTNTCNEFKHESEPHESCANGCNYLNPESGPHESCANGCNYLNPESGVHESSAHACNNLNHESGVHESFANACNNLNYESGVHASSANASNNLNKESESHERTSEAAVLYEKNSKSRSRKEMHVSKKRSLQKRKKHSTSFVSKTQRSSHVPGTDVCTIVSDSSDEVGPTFAGFRKSLKLRNETHPSTRKSSEETVPIARIFNKSNLSPLNCERSESATQTEPNRGLAEPRGEFYIQYQESFGNYMNTSHLDDIQQQTETVPSPTGCRVSMRRRKLFESNPTEFYIQDQETFGSYMNTNHLDDIQQQTETVPSTIGYRVSMRRSKLFESNERAVCKVSKTRKKDSSKKQKAKNKERKKTIEERCFEYEEFLKTIPIDDLCYKSPSDE